MNNNNKNKMKKHTIPHLATLALAMLMAAACNDDLSPAPGTPDGGNGNALLALPPETPVDIRTTLQAFGTTTPPDTKHADTRTTRANADGSRDINLADIPARNEITTETVIAEKENIIARSAATLSGAEWADAYLYLPGATDEANRILRLTSENEDITLNNMGKAQFAPMNSDDAEAPFASLRLRHLNLKAADAAGTPQPHSRLAVMDISNDDDDQLLAVAPLGATTGTDDGPGFNFRLRHTTAKISLLVTNTNGTPLDMSGDMRAEATIYTDRTSSVPIYTGSGNSADGYPALTGYLTTPGKDSGNYPEDPAGQTETAICLDYSGGRFKLFRPDGTGTVPVNLLNGIVHASVTHKRKLQSGDPYEGNAIYTYTPVNADGTPVHYAPRLTPERLEDALALRLSNTVDGSSPDDGYPNGGTGNYILGLTDIVLTNLPEGDARRDAGKTDGTGHLLYLLPGEHLTLTVSVDRNRIAYATGTIGAWSNGSAGEDLTEDDSKRLPLKLTNTDPATGARTYEVPTVDGLQALAAWINGTGPDPITGKPDESTEKATRLATNINLTNDIDLSTLPKEDNGSNWTPIGINDSNGSNPYTGTFDGGGYTISNLVVNHPELNDQGLFGYSRGTVKNVTVEGSVTGYTQVGGIVGLNYGRIENCTNQAMVTGHTTASKFGGVVGYNSGSLTACTNTAQVKGGGMNAQAGGVAGYNRGYLTACTNTGTVNCPKNNANVGGVAGSNSGFITACYNTGTVTGGSSTFLGGVTGNSNGDALTACYNTGDVRGGRSGAALVGSNQNTSLAACFYHNGSALRGIGLGDGEKTAASDSDNRIFHPVGNVGYPQWPTWDVVMGEYADTGTGTLNKELYNKRCPYKFVPNPAEETYSGGPIPGGVGSEPLLLVPVAQ